MSLKDESTRTVGNFTDVPIRYNEPWNAVRDDISAYDEFVANLGIQFQHWIAIPYVIGDTSLGDIRSYGNQKVSLNDPKLMYDHGFIYKFVGIVYGVFQGAGKAYNNNPGGYFGDGTASITFNRFYKNTECQVSFSEFDKLIPHELPEDVHSVYWQKFMHNSAGKDRLTFRASDVEWLIDSTGREYIQGVDFNLENGLIAWTQAGSRPGIDLVSGQGKICSARYKYKPFYYIKQMVHDLRVHATIDPITQDVRTERSNVQAVVQLDYVFLASLKNQENPEFLDSAEAAPRGNNTGPR